MGPREGWWGWVASMVTSLAHLAWFPGYWLPGSHLPALCLAGGTLQRQSLSFSWPQRLKELKKCHAGMVNGGGRWHWQVWESDDVSCWMQWCPWQWVQWVIGLYIHGVRAEQLQLWIAAWTRITWWGAFFFSLFFGGGEKSVTTHCLCSSCCWPLCHHPSLTL